MKKTNLLFVLLSLLCLTPWMKSSFALLLGILATLFLGNPYKEQTKKWSPRFLSLAIIGLGAGVNLKVIAVVGSKGVVYTIAGIGFTFLLGLILRKLLGLGKDSSLLITAGTAICGGSAIAAVAPTIKAKSHDVSIALGVVFLLNACALFLFPWIGHGLELSQSQFGLWSALAIHDTSSVVGAGLQYGSQALEVGTTVKLTRALWIIPMTLIIAFFQTREEEGPRKIKIPWFILGFIFMAGLVTFIPELKPTAKIIELGSKQLMVFTLFLIGANLSKEAMREVGVKSLVFGILLWFLVGGASLIAVYAKWIAA